MKFNELELLMEALQFATVKHKSQVRKDADRTPYIAHPIAVCKLLVQVGKINDIEILMASLLHDTIEDTDTKPEEITLYFGEKVTAYVLEVSDNKTLQPQERKRLQIEHAPFLSYGAKLVKLADKINNVYDIGKCPPPNWNYERKNNYLQWAEKVVDKLGNINENLEKLFKETLHNSFVKLNSSY